MKVLYSKFTRERNPQFQLETSIVEDEQGIKTVQKRALNPSGKKHIVNMYENYLRFSKKGTSCFLECMYKDDKVIFPYVEGKSLYAQLVAALDLRDKESFCYILRKYKEILKKSVYDVTSFKEEERFKSIFGVHSFPDNIKAARFLDVDLTFDNIIIDHQDQIKILDYEWIFECLVPVNFAVYRAAFAFYLKHGGQMNGIMTEDEFYAYLGIEQKEKKIYGEMNQSMMAYIMSSSSSLNNYKKKVRFLYELVQEPTLFSQMYVDTGSGYSEEESTVYPLKSTELENIIKLDLEPYKELRAIRFDPLNFPCGIKIYDIYAVTKDGKKRISYSDFLSNATEIYEEEADFLEQDPQIIIEIKKEEHWKKIVIHYEILFYREKEQIICYGNQDSALQLLEKENELFLKREFAFKKREEEYRTSLANAISELENLKERDQLLKDKLRYIEETKAYRLFLKEKVKKLGLWDEIQQDHL